MLQFPLVKGNKAIKHKWKGNFPFSNPISCNNIVRSAERLVQSDEESHRSLWRSKSIRMAYSCGSSQNPAYTPALGQRNNCKETRHLPRNSFWGHAAVMCGIFSLPAIYSWAGQVLVPIQSGLLIWACICKEFYSKAKKLSSQGLTVEQHITDLESEQQCSHLLQMTLKGSVFQSHQDISGAQFSLTLMQKEQLALPRMT